jgi:hypothetical protein
VASSTPNHDTRAFISFCSADRGLAQRIQRDFNEAGCITWQFDISAVPGTDAWETILGRIEQSEFFIVLLSEAATRSSGVREEISSAHYYSLNSAFSRPRIIPLVLQDHVTVPRKIARLVRLPFHENTYDADLALLLRAIGIEASPFEAATALEVTSTRAYELEAEREAARYATSLIKNNETVAASFQELGARVEEWGGNFNVLPAKVITKSEEVVRSYTLNESKSAISSRGTSLHYTFWVFFGIWSKHSKGYFVRGNVVMQLDALQDRQFSDEYVLQSDSLRLRFEGFQTITATSF